MLKHATFFRGILGQKINWKKRGLIFYPRGYVVSLHYKPTTYDTFQRQPPLPPTPLLRRSCSPHLLQPCYRKAHHSAREAGPGQKRPQGPAPHFFCQHFPSGRQRTGHGFCRDHLPGHHDLQARKKSSPQLPARPGVQLCPQRRRPSTPSSHQGNFPSSRRSVCKVWTQAYHSPIHRTGPRG